MGYEYNFNREGCWYKEVCRHYENDEICNPGCPRYMEMHYLMNTSGIPKVRQYPTILKPGPEDYDAFIRLKNIKDNIKEFVEQGDSLYIVSEKFGNGKTTWAIKLMQQFFDKSWNTNGFKTRGVFINVPTFLTKVKEGFNYRDDDFETLKRNIPKVDLVIWDDIASTKLSAYDHNLLLAYIDERGLARRSNIYTGNILPENLLPALGGRLTSRIGSESSVIEFKGEDRRGMKW